MAFLSYVLLGFWYHESSNPSHLKYDSENDGIRLDLFTNLDWKKCDILLCDRRHFECKDFFM